MLRLHGASLAAGSAEEQLAPLTKARAQARWHATDSVLRFNTTPRSAALLALIACSGNANQPRTSAMVQKNLTSEACAFMSNRNATQLGRVPVPSIVYGGRVYIRGRTQMFD